MTDNTKDLYSVLSKASYDYYHGGLDKAQKELGSYSQTKDYRIDPKLSNKNAVVLEKGNDIVISYRGTDLKNPSDILADAEILLGRDKIKLFLNDRFDEANSLYNKVKNENPGKNITLTGHSLGSAEAIYVGTKNDTRSISFNEGTSPLDALFSQFGSKETNRKQTVYITGKDIISNLSILEPYDIRFVSAKDDLNFLSHSLNYFLPDKAKYSLDYLKATPKYNYKPKKSVSIDTYGIDYFKDLARKSSVLVE
jgi:predicted esterase YcpF (UPF0227 family)